MVQRVRNQHYIPRSYQKNFGFRNPSNRKWKIHNIENGGEIKVNNTEKICKEFYLYDLPFVAEEHRQFIEHAYDIEVDRIFPEITEFICDESNNTMSDEMRHKIVKSALSLYYRTPRFVSVDPTFRELISELPENRRNEAYNQRKTELLERHIVSFEELYRFKLNDGISINKAPGDTEFITGDNPVIIRNREGNLIEALDPNNIIHIPITPKYCITITPKSEVELGGEFIRFEYNKWMVAGINGNIDELHQTFLMGTEKGLTDYLSYAEVLKSPAEENDPIIENIKALNNAANQEYRAIKNYGVGSPQHQMVFMYHWEKFEWFREEPTNITHKKEYGF